MLEVGMTALPKTADPREQWNFQHFLVIQCLYQTLVRVSESGRLVSDLAERWQIDPTGKLYTFELNEKAVFHDGTPVTAKDVAFSFARQFWPGSPSLIQFNLRNIIEGANHTKAGEIPSGIKVLGEHTVQFSLVHAYPPLLFVLAMPGFSIVSKKNAASNSHEWVGSGPMKGKLDPATGSWTLEVFDRYSGSKAKMNGIHIRGLANFAEAESLMKNQALDVIVGAPLSEVVDSRQFPGYQVTRTNSIAYSHLFYNGHQPVFKNLEFRKDLGHLIQGIAKRPENLTRLIQYEPTYIPQGVMPTSYYQRAEVELSPEAFTQKWSSLIRSKRLHIVVLKNTYSQHFLDQLEATIRKTGFDLQFDRIAVGEYLDILKNQKYDIITGLYVGNFPDPDGFIDPLNESSKLRIGIVPSHDLFKEIEKVRDLVPAEKRLEEYSRLLRRFEEQWHFVPMYRISMPIIHNEKVKIPDTSFRYEAELWNMFWAN